MEIQKEVHWFMFEDDSGFGVLLFTSEKAMWARMKQTVRDADYKELAEEMDKLPEGDAFDDLWEQFICEEQYRYNYYNYGMEVIAFETTPEGTAL